MKDRLADEKATEEIQAMHDQVENKRSAGKSLKEIADEMKLQFREIAEIGPRQQGARRQAGDRRRRRRRIVERRRSTAASASRMKRSSCSNGGYAWVDVLGITPQKQKPFEEVKEEVKAASRWKTERARS